MKRLLVFLALAGLVPVEPLPASATLTTIDVTLDRATAWRSRSKPGRIKAYGTFRGVGGPFDMTQIVVTVTDGQDLDESGTFTSCREYPSGTVRCQNDDRSARIRYIPDRTDPDLYRYKLDYRRRDITRPQVAPLQIEFDYAGGAATDSAKNEPCRVYNAKLVCKGTSAPVETCSDGVQNQDETDVDCGGSVCGACGEGLGCGVPGDCQGGICTASVCDCAGAGGTFVSGLEGCWFLGDYGESCTDVCSGQAPALAYSERTASVAGSGGTGAACVAVLTALNATPAQRCDGSLTPPTAGHGLTSSPTAAGCSVIDLLINQPDRCDAFQDARQRFDWYRIVSPATLAGEARNDLSRACACQ